MSGANGRLFSYFCSADLSRSAESLCQGLSSLRRASEDGSAGDIGSDRWQPAADVPRAIAGQSQAASFGVGVFYW